MQERVVDGAKAVLALLLAARGMAQSG
jgi:hypothetical protein